MRKLNSQFITTFVSEAGLDGQNGTYYGFVEMDRYYCMAVAQGYDADGGFDSAKLAVDAAMDRNRKLPEFFHFSSECTSSLLLNAPLRGMPAPIPPLVPRTPACLPTPHRQSSSRIPSR